MQSLVPQSPSVVPPLPLLCQVLITAASSNGRCNTIWYKAVFLKVVFMKPGKRLGHGCESLLLKKALPSYGV
jgi:hypothetical protein